MKKQVVIIHGGDVWKNYEVYLEYLKTHPINFDRHALRKGDYRERLAASLGEAFEVIRPDMPNHRNARYEEWKIWFEKFVYSLWRSVDFYQTLCASKCVFLRLCQFSRSMAQGKTCKEEVVGPSIFSRTCQGDSV